MKVIILKSRAEFDKREAEIHQALIVSHPGYRADRWCEPKENKASGEFALTVGPQILPFLTSHDVIQDVPHDWGVPRTLFRRGPRISWWLTAKFALQRLWLRLKKIVNNY